MTGEVAVPSPIRGPEPEHGQGPARMTFPEAQRVRQAALMATRLYPGPVGELVARELRDWAEWGYVFGPGLVHELVDHVMAESWRAA